MSAATDLGAVLDELHRRIAAVRELHVERTTLVMKHNADGVMLSYRRQPDGYCRACSQAWPRDCCRDDPDDCNSVHMYPGVKWPCATLRALDGEQP